jgi:hypothetical protein
VPLTDYYSDRFKGPTRDDYVQAAATYENAANEWRNVVQPDPSVTDPAEREKLRKASADRCHDALEKVAKWEGFTLDARIGLRVKAGQQTLLWVKGKKGWA